MKSKETSRTRDLVKYGLALGGTALALAGVSEVQQLRNPYGTANERSQTQKQNHDFGKLIKSIIPEEPTQVREPGEKNTDNITVTPTEGSR